MAGLRGLVVGTLWLAGLVVVGLVIAAVALDRRVPARRTNPDAVVRPVSPLVAAVSAGVTSPSPDSRVIAPQDLPVPTIAPAELSAAAPCDAPGFAAAAHANAASLTTLAWSPFRRPEVGWRIYAPTIGREIGAACGPDTEAFVRLTAGGVCPPGPADAELATAATAEGYDGKAIRLTPAALAAYRRMVAAARAEVPSIAADARLLTIFSGYRSPEADAARCARDHDCAAITRAACSAHRTGAAVDLVLDGDPRRRPDSAADDDRLRLSRSPAYLWLIARGGDFGFINYPFEPWHWEWTGRP